MKMNVNIAGLLILLQITTVICNGRSGTDKYQHPDKNFKCIKCSIGKYVAGYCTEDLGYSTCEACEENQYVSDGGATSCAPCTDCTKQDHKTVEYIKCTKSEDTVCVCPTGQIFKDGLCERCTTNEIVERTRSDVNGKCVKCESGSFYNNDTMNCSPCSSCAHDEVIVRVCEGSNDVQCNKPTDELSPGTIAGIVLGVIFAVAFIIIIIIIIIIIKCKGRRRRRPPQSSDTVEANERPIWVEPLIRILINNLIDHQSYFHTLDDFPDFNCRTKLVHLEHQHQRDAAAVIRNFVYQYNEANPDTVTPITFATALERTDLNDIVGIMRADPILMEYFVEENRDDRPISNATPLLPNQGNSLHSRGDSLGRASPNDIPLQETPTINNNQSRSSNYLPTGIPYADNIAF